MKKEETESKGEEEWAMFAEEVLENSTTVTTS